MKMNRIVLTVIVSVVLAGCSSTGSLQCAAAEGAGCMSAKDVYHATSYGGSVHDTPESLEQRQAQQFDSRINAPYVDVRADRPTPIRTPTRTIRIYVSSYEDERNQMLVAPHYIFNDVEDRTWVIGDENVTRSERLGTPLRGAD